MCHIRSFINFYILNAKIKVSNNIGLIVSLIRKIDKELSDKWLHLLEI